MKTSVLVCSIASLLLSGVARPQAGGTDEPAVWRAMAEAIARDNASHPFRQLYFKTDFSSAPMISTSMSDPDRDEFCGLARPEAEAMVGQLLIVNAAAVELDASIAERAGLRISRKMERTMRYVALSRVVFDAVNQRAWLAVDLSGGRGGIMRLDKTGGGWSFSTRCAAWIKPRTR
jgi:hypothetical protein